jgi:hypothetical protein
MGTVWDRYYDGIMGRYEGLKTCFVAIHRIKHSISHDDCRVYLGHSKHPC